jgi:FkbM family methyltransferase
MLRDAAATGLTKVLKATGFGVHPIDQVAWVDRFEQLNANLLIDTVRNAIEGVGKSDLDQRCLEAYLRGAAQMARDGVVPISQLGQDVFVLGLQGPGGYFLDIGAASPEYLSNTFVLERSYGWSGIVVEPDPTFADLQRRARGADSRSVVFETALGEADGEALLVRATELSTLSTQLDNVDGYSAARLEAAEKGDVVSVQLNRPATVLAKAIAPSVIDFLSLDVEGSELTVLRNFPFDSYRIRSACIEHNGRSDLPEMVGIMRDHGLVRVLEGFSGVDAWFVEQSLLEALG